MTSPTTTRQTWNAAKPSERTSWLQRTRYFSTQDVLKLAHTGWDSLGGMEQTQIAAVIHEPAPMKGLRAYVLRAADVSDCTNGGISSRFAQVTIVGDGIPELFSASDDAPAVKVIRRIVGREYVHVEPVEAPGENAVGWMAGGNFAYSHDSRFRDLVCPYPVSIHDRKEIQRQYAENV